MPSFYVRLLFCVPLCIPLSCVPLVFVSLCVCEGNTMHRSPVQRFLAITVTGLLLVATLLTTLFVTQIHAAPAQPSRPLLAPPITARGKLC